MTIETTIAQIAYVFAGVATFSYNFQVDDPANDLLVQVDNNTTVTTLAHGADPGYTYTANSDRTGNITVVDSGGVLGTTGVISIKRVTEKDQDVDLIETGAFSMEVIEAMFDKLTMICQEIADDVQNYVYELRNQGAWTTGTAYTVGDIVLYSGVYYICMVAHTAGLTFDSDYWGSLFDPTHTHNASEIDYSNATSGLTATDVQAAIDELMTVQPETFIDEWDASGGTAPSTAGRSAGDYYIISKAGTISTVYHYVGDRLVYDGVSAYVRIPGQNFVRDNLIDCPNFDVDTLDHFGSGTWGLPNRWHGLNWHISLQATYGVGQGNVKKVTRGTISKQFFWLESIPTSRRGNIEQIVDVPLDSIRDCVNHTAVLTVSAEIYQGSFRVYFYEYDPSIPDRTRTVLGLPSHYVELGLSATLVGGAPAAGESAHYMDTIKIDMSSWSKDKQLSLMVIDNNDGTVSPVAEFRNLQMSLYIPNSQYTFIPKPVSVEMAKADRMIAASFSGASGIASTNALKAYAPSTGFVTNDIITRVNFPNRLRRTPTTVVVPFFTVAGVSRTAGAVNIDETGFNLKYTDAPNISSGSVILYHYYCDCDQ